jgi:predicted Zn-dependent protease
MKKVFSLLLMIALLIGCATVPLTGRKQMSLIPNSQILPLSYMSYKDVLGQNKLSTNTEQVAMIRTVGAKIEKAVEDFMAQNNLSSNLEGYEWEFNLIQDDKTVNAWCMPGGKVAFYTGIMPICQDEKGVAVVMGHEIAHAVANHGRERMSQQMIQQLGGVALSVAVQDEPEQMQQIYYMAYAIGSTYGAMLPYSRLHEKEADKLGLIFMAMAGYDPHEAPIFWERMAKTGGPQPPEFLSTHPSHEHRISELNNYMSTAMKYYNGGKAKKGGGKASIILVK